MAKSKRKALIMAKTFGSICLFSSLVLSPPSLEEKIQNNTYVSHKNDSLPIKNKKLPVLAIIRKDGLKIKTKHENN